MENFTFKVYNNRRSCYLTYKVQKTNEGWHISHIAIYGDCTPDGSPFFYENFDQDNIEYPSSFGGFLDYLWRQLESKQISHSDAQKRLQELADWVTLCEQKQPQWQGWNC